MDHAALWASGRASSSSAVNSIATPPAVSFSTGLAAATDELEKPNKQNRYEVNKFHRFSDFRLGPVVPGGFQVADSIQVCRISKGRTTHLMRSDIVEAPCAGFPRRRIGMAVQNILRLAGLLHTGAVSGSTMPYCWQCRNPVNQAPVLTRADTAASTATRRPSAHDERHHRSDLHSSDLKTRLFCPGRR
jgi:hypothetical protein